MTPPIWEPRVLTGQVGRAPREHRCSGVRPKVRWYRRERMKTRKPLRRQVRSEEPEWAPSPWEKCAGCPGGLEEMAVRVGSMAERIRWRVSMLPASELGYVGVPLWLGNEAMRTGLRERSVGRQRTR